MMNCTNKLTTSDIFNYFANNISFFDKLLMKYRLNTLGTPSTHAVYVFLLNSSHNKLKLRFVIHTGSGLIGRRLYSSFLKDKNNFKDLSINEKELNLFLCRLLPGIMVFLIDIYFLDQLLIL